MFDVSAILHYVGLSFSELFINFIKMACDEKQSLSMKIKKILLLYMVFLGSLLVLGCQEKIKKC